MNRDSERPLSSLPAPLRIALYDMACAMSSGRERTPVQRGTAGASTDYAAQLLEHQGEALGYLAWCFGDWSAGSLTVRQVDPAALSSWLQDQPEPVMILGVCSASTSADQMITDLQLIHFGLLYAVLRPIRPGVALHIRRVPPGSRS
jgi:hypothetical protein